jgi:hypothetical protein
MKTVLVADDEPMQINFSDPPRWLLAVWIGLIGGAGVGFFFKTDGTSWTASGIIAGIAAIPFALATWRLEPQWRRKREELEGDLSADKLKLARRAAVRGPVPTDPEIRAAALRIASDGLTRSRWQPGPRLTTALGGVMAIACVGAAVSRSLWALPYAFSATAMLYSGWYLPRQLRRRIELLSAVVDTPTK